MGLFNTTHIHQSKSCSGGGAQKVNMTVHEHRAPTDKSVEILQEMRDASRRDLIESFKGEANLIKYDAFVFSNDEINQFYEVAVRLDINGEQIDLRFKVDKRDLSNRDNMLNKIHLELSKEIALKIFIANTDTLDSVMNKYTW